jgi:hypothetical protein
VNRVAICEAFSRKDIGKPRRGLETAPYNMYPRRRIQYLDAAVRRGWIDWKYNAFGPFRPQLAEEILHPDFEEWLDLLFLLWSE